jgi:hypothetical protein
MTEMRRFGFFQTAILLLAIVRLPYSEIAPDFANPPPARQAVILKTITEYEWWLLTWAENNLVCRIYTEDEGVPVLADAKADCSSEVYKQWGEQPLCSAATTNGNLASCKGYYLLFVRKQSVEREVVVDLPPISATLTIEGCTQTNYQTTCPLLPTAKITGLEPLPEHRVTQIHYEYRGRKEVCQGTICEIRLSPSAPNGEQITFWADSSFGDTSEVYEARVRINANGVGKWQLDLLSGQSTDLKTEAFAMEWNIFPQLDKPLWLSHSLDPNVLTSNEPYQYLAGQLIRAGVANASGCTDGGLLGSGYASQCGLEQSIVEVVNWQNRFDPEIIEVAEQYSLSPFLLKKVIAQESQFWPGKYEISLNEYGLARITEAGADGLLMWNEGFYVSFCKEILSEEACMIGYNQLSPSYQQMLRGALASRVNVDCESCEYGFDLSRADYDIEVLAQSLLASASQVNQIYINLTGKTGGASSSYEDLWRFSLVNYNAGPGCLSAAMKATQTGGTPLDWGNVSAHLVGDCRAAIGYVDNIAK